MGLLRRDSARPTLRSRRMRCAVAGSGLVPNSSRSPPAQKARLLAAAQLHPGDAGVRRGQGECFDELVAHQRVQRVQTLGPGERD